MIDYINKFKKESDYNSQKSSIIALGKSSVSLAEKERIVHFDGVNVVVPLPKVGDAVYVPTSCVYSAATPGSGVTEGSVTFISGETLNHSAMTSAGYTAVGVVVGVHGRTAVVLWKTGSGTLKFVADATDTSFTIPSSVLSDSEYAKIYVPTMRDKAGRVGFRQTGSTDVLAKWLMGQGGSGGNESWNGGTESNAGDSFFTAKEWGWTNSGPDASKVVPDSFYQAYESDPSVHTEAGWRRYLESRKFEKPSRYQYAVNVYGNSKVASKVLTDVNAAQDRAYFPVAQFAKAHNATWGSYGEFYNVPGLKHGDWFMMGLDYAIELFENVRYSLSGYDRNSDPVNRTLNAMSGQAIEINRNNDACRYWFPFLRSRGYAWNMYISGYFSFNPLSYARRSLSAALLDI